MRLWLPTNPPIHTDFDIVEEGNVPLLLLLPQMQNLRFKIDLTPEAVYITSPAWTCVQLRDCRTTCPESLEIPT